jgi:hypothetical protein
MKNTTAYNRLILDLQAFGMAYNELRTTIEDYEQMTKTSVNDLKSFTGSYPFDKSFDELPIQQWVNNTINELDHKLYVAEARNMYKILDSELLNTGGGTMVEITEVFLKDQKKTVFVFTNEEGCTMSLVDYIRHDFESEDCDEYIIDQFSIYNFSGHESYFELYRDCVNNFTDHYHKGYGVVSDLPYDLLSDELQAQITEDYYKWEMANNSGIFTTDGQYVQYHHCYKAPTCDDIYLPQIKDFRNWHSLIACNEEYYDKDYTLKLADKQVKLPFVADVWTTIDDALRDIINNF